jgi:hypothetical protein
MGNKEVLLEVLLTQELQRISEKMDFWNRPVNIPNETGWVGPNAITLERFLESHPLPDDPKKMIIYGIAWEFIWGKPAPEEIKAARESLLVKAKTGMHLSEEEILWLNVISVDTNIL